MRCGISSPKVISRRGNEPTAAEKEGRERGNDSGGGRRIGIQNPPGSTRQSVRPSDSFKAVAKNCHATPHGRRRLRQRRQRRRRWFFRVQARSAGNEGGRSKRQPNNRRNCGNVNFPLVKSGRARGSMRGAGRGGARMQCHNYEGNTSQGSLICK